MPDLQPHSQAMGQKDGVLEERQSQKWTAAADLQPTISKSDRLLAAWQSQFHGCNGLGRTHSTKSRLQMMRDSIEN